MTSRTTKVAIALTTGAGLLSPSIASARAAAPAIRHAHHGVHFAGTRGAAGTAQRGGYQALVSDGSGTGFGFHHLPYPLHVAAVDAHNRQAAAVRSAVTTDAFTQGFNSYGFRGDSTYGEGNRASYGVFDGPDGYGSPYFAGYYGRGEGTDYGVFGRAYN